ncbi:hypothetical protein [Thermococcus aciditolerans]|uniref:Uncharacterized protein n=1 Tax=Thermococcus aciditolerans TaxID=2598455 RepID=A0A5C0SI05_9EURY|nr:hypothetical protein [Thermococcus aciditolerans]QEK13820.1 hypothetical protein FPV09_00320 [Thermococcus aciditolerans]
MDINPPPPGDTVIAAAHAIFAFAVIVIYPIFVYYIVLTIAGLRYNSKFRQPPIPKDLPPL